MVKQELRVAVERTGWCRMAANRVGAGFTLVELLVVLAIVALLLSIAAPRYFAHVERAKEAALRQDLSVVRDAIDKFYGDKGRYPEALEELVRERYLRAIPVDPFTESDATWVVLPPPLSVQAAGSVYDLKSGAAGVGSDGRAYADW
jgi:general secretion pathway protein G